jgi:hypothetical protein
LIEDLQRLAVRAGVAAVATSELDPEYLIPALDFALGRDRTARAEANGDLEPAGLGPATIEFLDEWRRGAGADIVAFIDDTRTLQLLIQPATGARHLMHGPATHCALDSTAGAAPGP